MIRLFIKSLGSAPLTMISSMVSYLIIAALRMLLILLDSSNSLILGQNAKSAYFGFSSYERGQLENESILNLKFTPKNVFEFAKVEFSKLFDFQIIGYSALAFLYFSSHTAFFANYAHLSLPLFMCLNVLVYFVNAVYTTYAIRELYRPKIKLADILRCQSHQYSINNQLAKKNYSHTLTPEPRKNDGKNFQ